MKNRFRLASLVATLAIVAAACSSGSSNTTAPGTSDPGTSEAPGSAPASAPASAAAFPEGDFALTLWTKEGEADGSYQFVKKLTDDFTAAHPNVTFEVVNKDVELLREDFQTSSLAGDAPELLWTVADHLGPFTSADLILPLDDMVDRGKFVPAAADAVTANDTLWGVPVSFGNQLMLYWNKELAGDTAPANSDEWIAAAKEAHSGDTVGIAFNQTESFWLVPFLGGYGGSVFAEDGVTPTLDTEAMQNALKFLYDLKYTEQVTPAEADYNVADGLFKEGKAAFIINGDWTLGAYAAAPDAEAPGLGDNLGVAPLPTLAGGEDPKPYIAGSFLMVSKAVGDNADLKTVVSEFLTFASNTENQVAIVETLKRLPGNAEAIEDPIVTEDPLLAGASEAAQKGVPQPTNLEMRCVFDAMNEGVRTMFTGSDDFAGLSAAMQSSAESCIAAL
jgi:arabinogalactan oligomer / maltooligosaccharide transport system substrate-binding protein